MIGLAVAATVLAAALPPGSAGTHTPDSPCVSGWEFQNLPDGLTIPQAAKWLDGPGVPGPGHSRHFKACGRPWGKARVIVRIREGVIDGAILIIVEEGVLL